MEQRHHPHPAHQQVDRAVRPTYSYQLPHFPHALRAPHRQFAMSLTGVVPEELGVVADDDQSVVAGKEVLGVGVFDVGEAGAELETPLRYVVLVKQVHLLLVPRKHDLPYALQGLLATGSQLEHSLKSVSTHAVGLAVGVAHQGELPIEGEAGGFEGLALSSREDGELAFCFAFRVEGGAVEDGVLQVVIVVDIALVGGDDQGLLVADGDAVDEFLLLEVRGCLDSGDAFGAFLPEALEEEGEGGEVDGLRVVHEDCVLVVLDSFQRVRVDLQCVFGGEEGDVVLEDIGALRLLYLPQFPQQQGASSADAQDRALYLDELNYAHLLQVVHSLHNFSQNQTKPTTFPFISPTDFLVRYCVSMPSCLCQAVLPFLQVLLRYKEAWLLALGVVLANFSYLSWLGSEDSLLQLDQKWHLVEFGDCSVMVLFSLWVEQFFLCLWSCSALPMNPFLF